MSHSVDCPRDIYLASKALRERAGTQPTAYTKHDLLSALHVGAGAIPTDPFYAPMWCALAGLIEVMEQELCPQ